MRAIAGTPYSPLGPNWSICFADMGVVVILPLHTATYDGTDASHALCFEKERSCTPNISTLAAPGPNHGAVRNPLLAAFLTRPIIFCAIR